jgi:hypothetical protein
MNTETSGKVTKARRFLERLGLSYDAMSPSTRKYLLDMEPSDSMNTNPAMVMSKQFDTIVDKEMEPMRGGRVSFPASYFGAPESPSYESVGGGGKPGYFTMRDVEVLQRGYQKKFLRKLRIEKHSKTALLNRLNNRMDQAVLKTVRENKGKLTIGGFVRNLKTHD